MCEYIDKNKNTGLFNIKLFNEIEKLYNNQIEKTEKIFKKYDVQIEDIKKKEMNYNIICAFNYGLKSNRAFKIGGNYKYNNIMCDLSKCIFKYDKYSSIIFYSNLYINNKLNITIVSPWLLD